ncbi:hypothetical protein EVA_19650 [gut metagenome]|uniref:Uncharacterized protein n=1 Tax=gut metagenome TaxID=749906 RepID=J9FY11_9ZZZZ
MKPRTLNSFVFFTRWKAITKKSSRIVSRSCGICGKRAFRWVPAS